MSEARRPLRVLSIINGLGTGGAERSLAELHAPLAERGVAVSYACFHSRDEGVEQRVRSSGARIELIPETGWVGRIRHLRRLVADLRPDLLHTSLFEANITGRLASVGRRLPVLTSLVNTGYEPGRRRDPNVKAFKLALARGLDAVTARTLTTHFHAITTAVKDSAVRRLGIDAARVTVIYRGRDPGRLGEPSPGRKATARASLGLDAADQVIVNVGRHEYQKGQDVLLHAFDRVAAQNESARLLIAGRKGNATADLERLAGRMSAGNRVTFLGHRDNVPEILAAADVFAFPSHYEGLGGAVIEAMALGLPVVASDLPAIREITEPGTNALLVEPNDPGALAGALDRVLADPDRQRSMGARGREIFAARFTLERCADATAALYREVAGTGSRSGSEKNSKS